MTPDRLAEWMADQWGLRPAPLQIPHCPRVVAGKRCLMNTRLRCVCQDYGHRLFDHGRLWHLPAKIRGRGEHVLSGEPYDFNWEDREAFQRETDATGLGVRLFVMHPDLSFWYPPHTRLLILVRDDTWLLPIQARWLDEAQ
jgi:hypothetical protein